MSGKTINILLAERDASTCDFVRQALADCSKTVKFNIETARELSEITELLNRKSFDIILLDMEIPDGRGIDVIKEIRGQSPHIPIIIVMTESADEEMEVQGIKSGADDYLVKGKIFRDVLGRSIRYAIERREERRGSEEKLAKAIKELEHSNKELNDFAYVISHDLKAPLRGIKSLAEWIATDYSEKLDDNGREQLKLLLSRVGRMHSLIDGVLQYSRVARVKEKMVPVNLNEIVPEIHKSIDADGKVEMEIETELPTILFEQTRIIQLFQNLLSNAVKYMDKPKGQVKVGCTKEGEFWKFHVADNGPGIEEKDFERIFLLFQTLAPKDQVESTGVGLTVAQKIVEMYGGRIWVESKVGTGSTFFFTIPIMKEITPAPASREAAGEAVSASHK